MTITWYGHSCFRIETKENILAGVATGQAGPEGVSVLIDPFAKDIGLRAPRMKDDLVLVTHQHSDHNNVQDAEPGTFIINGPGEYERKGVAVQGILSYHDKSEGSERGLNTIYIIKTEDLAICHLGDLGQEELSDSQLEAIGDVDILMVPVGGTYTIDGKTAMKVFSQIEPKIVIPMHYKIPGLKIDLDGPEPFVKELGLTPEKVDKFKISKKLLPTEETKLIMLQV